MSLKTLHSTWTGISDDSLLGVTSIKVNLQVDFVTPGKQIPLPGTFLNSWDDPCP